jgi:hypothetical protein
MAIMDVKNLRNVEVRRIIPDDAPKFVDAYIFHAETETGRVLTQKELDVLNADYDTVQEYVQEQRIDCMASAIRFMSDPREVAKHKRDKEESARQPFVWYKRW